MAHKSRDAQGSKNEAVGEARRMIDNIALLVSHGLLLLACWRLLSRDDLDDESASATEEEETNGVKRNA